MCIDVKFILYDNAAEKIKKVVLSQKFGNDQETEASLFVNTADIKGIFKRHKITPNIRPMLYWNNTKTGEKTLESLD